MGFWSRVRRGQRQIGKQSHPSDLSGGYFLPALAIPASVVTPAHGEGEASWSESWFIFAYRAPVLSNIWYLLICAHRCQNRESSGQTLSSRQRLPFTQLSLKKISSAVSQEGLSTATRLLRWQRLNCAGAFKPCFFLLADNANCHYQ
jgi:hypothetical protein